MDVYDDMVQTFVSPKDARIERLKIHRKTLQWYNVLHVLDGTIITWSSKEEKQMSEQSKTVVDVVLVEVIPATKEEAMKREVMERFTGFAFSDLTDEKIREKVLFEKHEMVGDAGGPDRVEVLVSRPFQN